MVQIKVIVAALLLFSNFACFSQNEHEQIMGYVIDTEKPDFYINVDYSGFKYFYGIYHLSIKTLKGDTIILGYLYNKITERNIYHNKFNFEEGKGYLFYVNIIEPCNCGFPKLEGCSYEENEYINSKYNVKYSKINRIIYSTLIDEEILKEYDK